MDKISPKGTKGCLATCDRPPVWRISRFLPTGNGITWESCTEDLPFTLPQNGDEVRVRKIKKTD